MLHFNLVITPAPEEKLPKAIVTEKSFDHVTLTFDHFAPENYAHSYVAMVSSVGMQVVQNATPVFI